MSITAPCAYAGFHLGKKKLWGGEAGHGSSSPLKFATINMKLRNA